MKNEKVEEGENSCGAYVLDLPGRIATGDTIEEARRLIAEAIDFHIEGPKKAGYGEPEPQRQLR